MRGLLAGRYSEELRPVGHTQGNADTLRSGGPTEGSDTEKEFLPLTHPVSSDRVCSLVPPFSHL